MLASMKRLQRVIGWMLGVAAIVVLVEAWTGGGRILRRVVSLRPDIVAWVGNTAITRAQVERAVHEQCWLEGRDPRSLDAGQLAAARRAALDRCIDDELLLADADRAGVEVAEAVVDERMRRFALRFETPGAMSGALREQGIRDESELRRMLAAQLRIEAHAASLVDAQAVVDDSEAIAFFNDHRDALAIPERVRVRHVFAATREASSDSARAKLEAVKRDLDAGLADFASLAAKHSDDPATKDRGGDLGWMTRHRLPADFADAVFALPVGAPALLRTRIGWHLAEVTARLPREQRSFEQARDEVVAALVADKRHRAAAILRDRLRRDANDRILVLPQRLDLPPGSGS